MSAKRWIRTAIGLVVLGVPCVLGCGEDKPAGNPADASLQPPPGQAADDLLGE